MAAATVEKASLIERLRGYFDETSRKALLERRASEVDFKQKELQQDEILDDEFSGYKFTSKKLN